MGCDIYPAEWVVSSMDVDVFYRAPYATDTEAYRSFIRQICETEQIDYVLPLTDIEIDVFQQWRQEDQNCPGGRAVVCMSDRETIHLCRNKRRAAQLLDAAENMPDHSGKTAFRAFRDFGKFWAGGTCRAFLSAGYQAGGWTQQQGLRGFLIFGKWSWQSAS